VCGKEIAGIDAGISCPEIPSPHEQRPELQTVCANPLQEPQIDSTEFPVPWSPVLENTGGTTNGTQEFPDTETPLHVEVSCSRVPEYETPSPDGDQAVRRGRPRQWASDAERKRASRFIGGSPPSGSRPRGSMPGGSLPPDAEVL
jgi:hypothetical protein